MAKISRYISGAALTVLVVMVLLIASNIGEPANACSGPSVIASVSPTQININESVTVTGQIFPVNPNATVRVTFVRADLSWVDVNTTVDASGNFSVTLKLDAYGFWTIYTFHDHINDRLSVYVISPPNSSPPPVPYALWNPDPVPNLPVIVGGLVIIIGGALAVAKIVRNKKRKVTSARVFVQIGALFFIFLGVFVSYNGTRLPNRNKSSRRIHPRRTLRSHLRLLLRLRKNRHLRSLANPSLHFPILELRSRVGSKLRSSRYRTSRNSVWPGDSDVSNIGQNLLWMGLPFRFLY
jgi:hypothetical protein